MTINEMRELLGLGSDVPDADVIDAYGAYVDGAVVAEVLPLTVVKKHLGVEVEDDDELIAQLINVAVEAIEGETGHLFGVREVTEHFKSFDAIRLRSWPVVSLTAIGYFDASGAAASFDLASVRLSNVKRPGRLILSGSAWPATMKAADAVSITMQAGYAADAVPHRLRHAALVMIADLYAMRESWLPGNATAAPISVPVERLLRSFETWSV